MNGKNQVALILTLCISLFSSNIYSQTVTSGPVEQAQKLLKAKYGLDPVLVNGKYFENIYRNDLGNPYYGADDFLPGYIIVHNKRINSLKLKYNLYNQTLVVSFNDGVNSPLVYIPPNEFIEEFSINGTRFRKYNFSGGEPEYYQDIFLGQNIKCLSEWRKKRFESHHMKTFIAYKFTDAQEKKYVILDNIAYIYRSNSSFVKIFPKEYRKDISKYMKEQKIKLKKSESGKLAELGAYCDTLLNEAKRD